MDLKYPRPHGYRTETEEWDKNTQILELVEKMLKEKEISEEDEFDMLFCVEDINGITSLSSQQKNIERMRYCNELINKIGENSS